MESLVLTIQIHTEDGEYVDWTVTPDHFTFQGALEFISRVLPHQSVTAFDYEDEDGDRVTVRSDDELFAMLNSFFGANNQLYLEGNYLPPLIIYPKSLTKPEKNIHHLKVATKSKNQAAAASQHVVQQQTRTPPQRDIGQILQVGNITDADLKLLEIIGSGNGGTVYRALHKPSTKIMAVKVVPLDVSPAMQKQIISELEILYRCHSPFIISYYGAFFVENRISICTEYMDGGSLDQFGQVPETVLGRIAVMVVKGLQYLWSLRIMHRDVKPSNMLVNSQGQVKLCDFGVSVQLVTSIARTYVGSNAYMAPERILGSEYKIQSDVWSVGISLFEMAIGRFPYDSVTPAVMANTPMDLLNCIVSTPPPKLTRGIFSNEFADFLEICMQRAPMSRPPPEVLVEHPFLNKYDDANTQIVASWVVQKLEEINLRKLAYKGGSA